MLSKESKKQLEEMCDDVAPYYILSTIIESYSNVRKRDLIDEMIEHLQREGYITIKPSSILEEQKIEEFIIELKPYHNERQYLFI
jgi:hypothetical protein